MKCEASREHKFPTLHIKVAPSTLRVLAGLFDLVIPIAISLGICLIIGYPDTASLPSRYWNHLDYLVDLVNSRPLFVLTPLLIFTAVYMVINTVLTATIGNSVLSRLVGMKTQNKKGRKIGVIRSAWWSFWGLVLGLVGFVGPLWTIVDPKRRMLHDILSGVVVVSGRANPTEVEVAPDRQPEETGGIV